MTCFYCKKDILGLDYINLWQPTISLYAPVHTIHIKANPKDTKGVISA